ncbi:MAG: MarR family transcriptional regulator [Acidobacteria bacterium]|nr:MarR family transcriptional regulator [Acidobacteriota bacterium]
MNGDSIHTASVKNSSHQDLLLKVAWLYYKGGLTQGDIAKRVRVSRPTVVRMLQQARSSGLVEIRLTRSLPEATSLATRIEMAFGANGLREAIIVEGLRGGEKSAVAMAAGGYLRRVLRSGDLLGVGWSTTLSQIPTHFRPGRHAPARIVQWVGAVGEMAGANAYDIALRLGSLLKVPVDHIPAPVIVDTPRVRRALLRDPTTRRTLARARKCNIGMVGIGVASSESTMIQTGYLTRRDLRAVARDGAVGDILLRYFDASGREIATKWQDRIVGVDLEELRRVENLIGVAAGARKNLAVLGALRGGTLNTLIVDLRLARAIAEQAGI